MRNANPVLNIPRLSGIRAGVLTQLAMLYADVPLGAEEAALTADFAVPVGSIRPLQGINKGPLVPGGLIDVIEEQKESGVPFTRLHDCGWTNPYVVDHHALFPNPNADPALPGSYGFRLTGAEPIDRLGESIEHKAVRPSARRPRKMGGDLPRDYPALQRGAGGRLPL